VIALEMSDVRIAQMMQLLSDGGREMLPNTGFEATHGEEERRQVGQETERQRARVRETEREKDVKRWKEGAHVLI
jgi:hypothetical protein